MAPPVPQIIMAVTLNGCHVERIISGPTNLRMMPPEQLLRWRERHRFVAHMVPLSRSSKGNVTAGVGLIIHQRNRKLFRFQGNNNAEAGDLKKMYPMIFRVR
jgi:hypothetical protein